MDDIKRSFLTKYKQFGPEKFFKFILNDAVSKIALNDEVNVNTLSPEVEMLNLHDRFLMHYRRENDEQYLEIARIFRKAAHRIYWLGLKKNMWNKNGRFLNVVG